MASVPTARAEVIHPAVSDEASGTSVQPGIAVPSEVKLTLPVGAGGPAGPTVAVMLTSSPTIEGLGELVTEVVLMGALFLLAPLLPRFARDPNPDGGH